MPEEDARGSLRTLLLDPDVSDRYRLMQVLAYTPSRAVAELLIDVEYNVPVMENGAKISILPVLKRVSELSDAATQSYIRERLAKHNASLNIPQAID